MLDRGRLAAWRQALRLGRSAPFAGFLILLGVLWKLAEITHTLQYILKTLAGIDEGGFDPLWLVAVGVAWLVILAIRASGTTERERAMAHLADVALSAAKRFEGLCHVYEEKMSVAQEHAVRAAREDFQTALTGLIMVAVQTASKEQREEYRFLLGKVLADFLQFHHDAPRSVFYPDLSPLMAISKALAAMEGESPKPS